MSLAAPYSRGVWGNRWRDQREERGHSQRVSEGSEEGREQSDDEVSSEEREEGTDQGDDTNHKDAGEAKVDTDAYSSSYSEDEEDDDDDNDDENDENENYSEEGLYVMTSQSETLHAVDEASVNEITRCEKGRELAMLKGEERGKDEKKDSDTDEDEAEDDSQEEDESVLSDYEDEEEYDEEDEDDEDTKTLYYHPTFPTYVFQALEDFRHSSLLTDLTLSTQDGLSLRAHSPVIAAVSSLIHQRLRVQGYWTLTDIHMDLGPEVTQLGLAAVLEFAYTGAMPTLNTDSVAYIRAAALALGIQRVLDLCKLKEEEEDKKKKIKEIEKEGEKKENILSASEELGITLQAIRQLWVEKIGCDVALEAERRIFHAHRVILAASSDYFRGMFTSGMRESRQWCVTLQSLGDNELESFLLCAYGGSLVLSWGWVFDLVCAAFQFQIQPVISLCLEFLQQEIDADSCLDVASFAEAYRMEELLQFADDFVLKHFQDVSKTAKFQDLPRKKVLKFLHSNTLYVPSEIVVLRAVMSWIGANPRERVRLSRDLIDTIKFPLLTFKEFNEAEAISRWPQKRMRRLYETMVEEFCSDKVDDQAQFRDYFPKDNMILVGGDGITPDLGNRKASRELWFSNSLRNHTGIIKSVEWRFLGEMPEKRRFGHEVAVLEGRLYVSGGRHYYGIDDVMKSMFRYDPFDNSWQRLADMQVERCQFSMVIIDQMIYVIGGERAAKISVDSVERYCPNTDSWSFVCPLDQPMSSHAASVWKGGIYVSGGLNCEYQGLVSMFLYHPEKGTTYLSDMLHNRAQHRMERVGDHLYVVGGLSTNDRGEPINQLSCEVYSPKSDFWSSICPVPSPHAGAASAVLEDKFYILGGYCPQDYSECKLIHRYDPATGHWQNMGKMPGPITDIRACVLCLPTHLKE